ncbi:MAG: hypothetical protein ACOY90_19130 [Candidatus Zhuqueibacterota bacterium]
MIKLHLKTKIPENRHLNLSLDLPTDVPPGDADIFLVVRSVTLKDNQKFLNQQIQKALLDFPVWSGEEIKHFEQVREELNKWKPDEF